MLIQAVAVIIGYVVSDERPGTNCWYCLGWLSVLFLVIDCRKSRRRPPSLDRQIEVAVGVGMVALIVVVMHADPLCMGFGRGNVGWA